jgi:hypothetical protein
MADRYWVGGTANWDGTAGTKWALTSGGAGGQAVPTSADDVFFTNLSTGTCTISAGNTGAKSITCTGHTGTIAGSAAISVAGSVTFVAGQTVTYSGSLSITATGTLTTGGKTLLGFVQINAPGGTVTLGSALTVSNSSGIGVSGGTLTTSASNFSITSSRLDVSSTLTLNGSTVTLTSGVINPSFNAQSFATINAGTSTINLVRATSSTFAGAGKTYNNVAFTSTTPSTSSILSIDSVTGANTFSQLTLAAPATNGVKKYDFAADQTITTFVCSGASATRRICLFSEAYNTRRTLTITTWSSITDVDFRSIGTNTARSGTRLGNWGNNNNITFDAAKTVYWNLTGTQNWSATGWATTSGGSPAANNFPLAQDTAVFDNAGAATTVSIDAPWGVGTVSMGGRTSAMTLSGSGEITVFGNWTYGTGVTASLSGPTIFAIPSGTQTITSNGKSFFSVKTPIFLTTTGTIVLADALTTTATTFNEGVSIYWAFTTNGFSVTTNSFFNQNTFLPGDSVFTLTGTGGIWTTNNSTITGLANITLSNATATARSIQLGTKTYGTLTIGGATGSSTTTIAGTPTFSAITSTKTVAHTIVFPNVTTTTAAWSVNGSAGNVVTLSRTGASGTFTLAKSGGGTVTADFLSISNSTATPGSTWTATNSIDGGGNTGWTITATPPAPPSSGNFLAFFM